MNPPTACPVCGAYSLTQEGQSSALLAVCDVLVLKALEKIGTRLVRQERRRYLVMNQPGMELHVAHCYWPTDDDTVDKALKGAWDVVPALVDGHGWDVASEAVRTMLDEYVHDLAITGEMHSLPELANRFKECLNMPVYLHTRTEVQA